MAAEAGVKILSIHVLQRFTDWDDTRAREAETLADYAQACGTHALVLLLVPTNDGRRMGCGATGGAARGSRRLAPVLMKIIAGMYTPTSRSASSPSPSAKWSRSPRR